MYFAGEFLIILFLFKYLFYVSKAFCVLDEPPQLRLVLRNTDSRVYHLLWVSFGDYASDIDFQANFIM